MLVRRELPGDVRAVADVHAEAFAPMYPEGELVEPGLVDAVDWRPQDGVGGQHRGYWAGIGRIRRR